MSKFNSQNSNQQGEPNFNSYDDFENDDLVAFKHNSQTINFYYSQIAKYSQIIRESYLFSDVKESLSSKIHEIQEKNHILSDSIVYFFQLLLQNFNFTENSILKSTQCSDLLKISKF